MHSPLIHSSLKAYLWSCDVLNFTNEVSFRLHIIQNCATNCATKEHRRKPAPPQEHEQGTPVEGRWRGQRGRRSSQPPSPLQPSDTPSAVGGGGHSGNTEWEAAGRSTHSTLHHRARRLVGGWVGGLPARRLFGGNPKKDPKNCEMPRYG